MVQKACGGRTAKPLKTEAAKNRILDGPQSNVLDHDAFLDDHSAY
jgi:hypothetical protein